VPAIAASLGDAPNAIESPGERGPYYRLVAHSPSIPRRGAYALPLIAFVGIAAGVYLVGRAITPDYYGISLFGKTAADTVPLKSWLATGALAVAVWQLLSALWIFGRLPAISPAPRPVKLTHRLTGAALILLTLPIAYHCMLAYGVQDLDPRVAVHSIAGSALYGAFAAKLIVVRSRRLPGWTLPMAGAVVVALVLTLWYTSALWYFDDYSLPAL
jgi:Family of unknown function (DUF6529)